VEFGDSRIVYVLLRSITFGARNSQKLFVLHKLSDRLHKLLQLAKFDIQLLTKLLLGPNLERVLGLLVIL
jgi:hypothetical protein